MGNDIVVYSLAFGGKYTNFLSDPYKFIENERIEGTSLKCTSNSLDPLDYLASK